MRRAPGRCVAIAIFALGLGACHRLDAAGHDHSHEPAGADEPEPIAITRFTDRAELFVELAPPEPSKSVAFHAHVTLLERFQAATEGRFTVRFKSGSAVVAETSADHVKRPGVFTPELTAPAAGRYAVEMVYQASGKSDVFDCGSVEVGPPKPASEEAASSALSFAKEQQWKIPFATAWAKKHPITRETELSGTVEPASGEQLTVSAPTGGRFFHNPKLELAEGRTIEKGDVVGFVAPSVAGDDYSRLTLSVEEGRIEKQRLEREIARVQPLVAQELLPERRLLELRSELDAAEARLKGARSRVGRVVAPGGAGGLPIKSTLAGVVSQVFVPNGESVEAGTPIARIGGTAHVWIRARFVARPPSELLGARPMAVRLPDGRTTALATERARFLSALPAVDPTSNVATWIVDVAAAPPLTSAGVPAPRSEFVTGMSVVLRVAVGAARSVVALPRSAVVEINTRPFVFVQTEGESFEKRAVRLGDSTGDLVEIIEGVAEGERVVTRGGFDVHLSSLMGAVESHRH